MSIQERYVTSFDPILIQRQINKQKDDFGPVLQQNVSMADCRFSRLEGKQGNFLLLFFE